MIRRALRYTIQGLCLLLLLALVAEWIHSIGGTSVGSVFRVDWRDSDHGGQWLLGGHSTGGVIGIIIERQRWDLSKPIYGSQAFNIQGQPIGRSRVSPQRFRESHPAKWGGSGQSRRLPNIPSQFRWSTLGFSAYHGKFDNGPGHWSDLWRVDFPVAVPVLLLAIANWRWLHRWSVQTRRRRKGLCLNCGYDLRATNDRCPECGAELVNGNATHDTAFDGLAGCVGPVTQPADVETKGSGHGV